MDKTDRQKQAEEAELEVGKAKTKADAELAKANAEAQTAKLDTVKMDTVKADDRTEKTEWQKQAEAAKGNADANKPTQRMINIGIKEKTMVCTICRIEKNVSEFATPDVCIACERKSGTEKSNHPATWRN